MRVWKNIGNIIFKTLFYPLRLIIRKEIDNIYNFRKDAPVKYPYYLSAAQKQILKENNCEFIHSFSLAITPKSKIGKNVRFYHNITVGSIAFKAPDIRDNVIIYPHCVLLGDIEIGHNAIVGAGSVVTKNVPPFSIVAGNPARVIRQISEAEYNEIKHHHVGISTYT